MSGAYRWLLALHVVGMIAWMAGILYLPRLFVYHSMAEPGSATSETTGCFPTSRRPAPCSLPATAMR